MRRLAAVGCLGMLCICLSWFVASTAAQPPVKPLPAIRVSANHRFLMEEDGKPFFYLGDTAWELFHRLDRKQAIDYLDNRARLHFNVVQAAALSVVDGITVPNAYGHLPLIDRDPARPAVSAGADPSDRSQYDYWDHVDFIVDEANRRGIYIGFVPTWGRWMPHPGGHESDWIFTRENARIYGEFLGKRYGRKGVIWILGGDVSGGGFEEYWRALARGIAIGATGKEDYSALLMAFHPTGGHGSAEWFHNDDWLSLNLWQTSHGTADQTVPWEKIGRDYARTPVKPVLDAEPLYEDHPIGFRQAKELGYSFDAHVRQTAYWDVFAGACGHAYGNHAVWQMHEPGWRAVNGPLFFWPEAIERPGAAEMQYVKALIESRPYFTRVPDQSIVANPLGGADYIAATRGDDYAFVYSAQGRPVTVNLGKISGKRVRVWLYNPRNGSASEIGTFENQGTREFIGHPIGGFGTDFVLVLDDADKQFPPPGR